MSCLHAVNGRLKGWDGASVGRMYPCFVFVSWPFGHMLGTCTLLKRCQSDLLACLGQFASWRRPGGNRHSQTASPMRRQRLKGMLSAQGGLLVRVHQATSAPAMRGSLLLAMLQCASQNCSPLPASCSGGRLNGCGKLGV